MFWKKTVNINFITVMAVVLFCTVLAVISGGMAVFLSDGVSQVGSRFNELREMGGDTVAGWGALFTGFAGMTGFLLVMVCWAAAIIMAVWAVLIFIPLLAARLLYRNTGGRLLAYRIIMGIDYFLLTLFTLMLCGIWLENDIRATLVFLPAILILAAIIAVNIINTYTDRIKRDGKDKAQ